MSIGRTIVALLIALSVAILPAAASAGMTVKSPQAAGIYLTEDMSDCCPHKVSPCEKAMDDCGAMAACALKCFSFLGTSAVIVFPSAFKDDGVVCRQSILFAGGQSTLPTSSGLTSP
jgi:hypothetical protein